MQLKQQIIDVLIMYKQNQYSTEIFCEMLGELCLFENDGINCFYGKQQEALKRLLEVTERYTPYTEDLQDYPNVYYTDVEVKKIFNEIIFLFL